ncbi:hypothetical protein WISP_34740 [Willisornis vidua]|uniref:Uncharacterized protein n=1 Tax=Willisornis vidua TaxID=1566151 RepID=A0ABQ9DPY1_9PASS|nr:hypothetical protein WISP_34740 [Willisornis vidua]
MIFLKGKKRKDQKSPRQKLGQVESKPELIKADDSTDEEMGREISLSVGEDGEKGRRENENAWHRRDCREKQFF